MTEVAGEHSKLMKVTLTSAQKYNDISSKISVVPNKKYKVSASVKGISGVPYSAFFGVLFFNKIDEKLGKRIRWLNDFSGELVDYDMVFQTPDDCSYLQLVYRINKQTLAKGECEYEILPVDKITVSDVPDEEEEHYESLKNIISQRSKLSPQEEDILESNLVWIFSHSKNTLAQLMSHQTPVMEDPRLGSQIIKMRRSKNRYIRDVDVRLERDHFFFNYKYANTWKFYLRKLILNRIHAQFKTLDSKIMIDAASSNSAADIIMQCLPNSSMVVEIQDGRDFVNSRIDSMKSYESSSQNRKTNTLTIRAKLWNTNIKFVMKAYESHAPERRMLIRYEDLRANTLEITKKIYQFIDVPISDETLTSITEKYHSESSEGKAAKKGVISAVGKWKERFTDEEKELLHGIMGQTLLELGYLEPGTIFPPPVYSDLEEMMFDDPENHMLPRPTELSPQEEEILESNLVWIFSNPKSGTTWLGTQLLSFQTNVMNEPLIGSHVVDPHTSSQGHYRDVDLRANRPDFFFNHKYANTWKFYLRKLILNRIYAQFNDIHKKVIIKEPNGSMGADIVGDCLPYSKIIALVRDGRDTVDSRLGYLKRKSGGQAGYATVKSGKSHPKMEILTIRAKLWNTNIKFVMKAYESHAPERRMLIRYEDLRANTLEITKKIYQFIDVPISDETLREIVDRHTFENIPDSKKGSGTFVRSASPGKWKKQFNDEEKETLQKIMGTTLIKLGYQD